MGGCGWVRMVVGVVRERVGRCVRVVRECGIEDG